MTSTIPGPSSVSTNEQGLTEMAWDPITRIVGSLGIDRKSVV